MNDVLDYAERIAVPGFAFMNTPGYDPLVPITGHGRRRREPDRLHHRPRHAPSASPPSPS